MSKPDTGSPPTGPGRISDTGLLRIFRLAPVVLAVVLLIVVALETAAR